MPAVWIKLLFSLAILAAGWIGGWVPLAAGGRRSGTNFMSWGNAFAAGIFLGTGLIHMLAEANTAWLELGWTYPMALVLAAAGFLAILLFEHVLMPRSVHHVVHTHSGEPLGVEQVERLAAGSAAYTLLLALSIHSVIAGVALGGQSSMTGAFYIFVAILAHKASAAFSLGISLARSEIPGRRSRRFVLIFALTTPLGILAGTVLSELLRSSVGRYFDASFLALAAGTFVYIASMDILQDEFLQAGGRFMKWLFAALAVGLMAVLSIWL